jgi:hypothetical protein
MVLTFTLPFSNVRPMDELLKLLNSMKPAEQAAFAAKCDGTTPGYLRKCISVGQLLGAKICVAIEEETKDLPTPITRKMLHPDDWEKYWPELADEKKAA